MKRRVSSFGALRQLGLEQSPRLFVGTVHSFCLLHLLLPFAQLAGLKLPYPLKVATESEAARIYRAVATGSAASASQCAKRK
jgi:DNA helicase II / ATP-dependent DNA helicase PcrA